MANNYLLGSITKDRLMCENLQHLINKLIVLQSDPYNLVTRIALSRAKRHFSHLLIQKIDSIFQHDFLITICLKAWADAHSIWTGFLLYNNYNNYIINNKSDKSKI
jgi:hypothetical protein